MDNTRIGLTVRLPPILRDEVQRIATAEKRSASAYVELLIERDLQARAEAARVIRVFVAPELEGKPFGKLRRRKGESHVSLADRQATIDKLLGA